jgi:Raf kinase inhibitor-like YbhB/YbcL family protein
VEGVVIGLRGRVPIGILPVVAMPKARPKPVFNKWDSRRGVNPWKCVSCRETPEAPMPDPTTRERRTTRGWRRGFVPGSARAAVGLLLAAVGAAVTGTAVAAAPGAGTAQMGGNMALSITSDAFEAGAGIPEKFTCDGADVAPPLGIDGVPDGARSLALIVDDPDAPDPAAPKRTWVHWVLYDLPPATRRLPEGGGDPPPGARPGTNDFGHTRYGGPCPPIGRHRYFFKLYALDRALGDLKAPTKARLLNAMEGHVVARAELVGTYQRGR